MPNNQTKTSELCSFSAIGIYVYTNSAIFIATWAEKKTSGITKDRLPSCIIHRTVATAAVAFVRKYRESAIHYVPSYTKFIAERVMPSQVLEH